MREPILPALIFFFAKKIQVCVIRFLTSIIHTLERRFFREKKKRKKETSITVILTIKSMKSVYLRA